MHSLPQASLARYSSHEAASRPHWTLRRSDDVYLRLRHHTFTRPLAIAPSTTANARPRYNNPPWLRSLSPMWVIIQLPNTMTAPAAAARRIIRMVLRTLSVWSSARMKDGSTVGAGSTPGAGPPLTLGADPSGASGA